MYLVQNSNHAKVPTCEIILRCSEKSARWRLGLLLISPGSPPALGAVGPVLHCKLGWEKKSTNCVHQTYFIINYIQGCKTFGCLDATKWREKEESITSRCGSRNHQRTGRAATDTHHYRRWTKRARISRGQARTPWDWRRTCKTTSPSGKRMKK